MNLTRREFAKANAAVGLGTIFYSLEMGKEPMAIRLAVPSFWCRVMATTL